MGSLSSYIRLLPTSSAHPKATQLSPRVRALLTLILQFLSKVSLKTTNFIRTPLERVHFVLRAMLTSAENFNTQGSTQGKFDVS